MHRWILGVGSRALAAVAASCASAALAANDGTACPTRPRAIVERFIGANCEACWTAAAKLDALSNVWMLDWIVPSERGDEAPLAAAAPEAASERARRASVVMAAPPLPALRRDALDADRGARLDVAAGPAWNGYFGVQLDSRGRWPKGSTAWLALVENVPPGVDGTPVPRQLVRTVAGPIALAAGARAHHETRAMRWPETAKPERLRAAAWIEAPDGRILAFSRSDCSTRQPTR